MKKPQPLHVLETVLVAVTSLHLCFLPWALGGVHVWSQIVSAAFAVLGFAISLVPRTLDGSSAAEIRTYIPLRRLVRFPVFWLGLLLLGYIVVQALNPAWEHVKESDTWWLVPLDHFGGIPSSVKASFTLSNPWRVALVFGSAWLVVCGLWIGCTRRVSVRVILTSIVVNGAALSLLGILQYVAGNGKVLWSIDAPATNFAATFFYKNHAGAYLNLLLAITSALGWWHFSRAERQLQRTSAAPLFALCGVLLAVMIFVSLSRASTLLMLVMLALNVCLLLRKSLRLSGARFAGTAIAIVFVAVAGTAGLSSRFPGASHATTRMKELFTRDRATSIEARQFAARATWEMASDKIVYGWGAGSFRYVFPRYQRAHPQILHPSWAPASVFHWEHAHNDYLEYLAEFGLCGAGLLAAILGSGVVAMIRIQVWRHAPCALMACGILLLLLHCWIDFNLQNPAILLTAGAIAALTVLWSRLELRDAPSPSATQSSKPDTLRD